MDNLIFMRFSTPATLNKRQKRKKIQEMGEKNFFKCVITPIKFVEVYFSSGQKLIPHFHSCSIRSSSFLS